MEAEPIGTEIVKFNVTDAEIAKLHAETKDLTIADVNDKPGYEAVHKARMVIKAIRVDVTKMGKGYREKANAYLKAVLAEEKRVLGKIQPIEDHLIDEETRYTNALAKIKADAEAAEAARVKARVDRLYQLDCRFDGVNWTYSGENIASQDVIAHSTDEQFAGLTTMLEEAAAEIAAIREREATAKMAAEAELAKVAEEQRIKAQELAAEQEKLARERAEIEAAKQKLIDDEAKRKKALEDAERHDREEKARKEELEAAKKEAAAKALKEAEEKAKKEAELKAKKEAAAKLAAEKKEARRPDRDKITNYLCHLNSVVMPEMKTAEGVAAMNKIDAALLKFMEMATQWAEEL